MPIGVLTICGAVLLQRLRLVQPDAVNREIKTEDALPGWEGRLLLFLAVLHGDEHAELAACCTAEAVVPADKVVIFGVDLREGGGVILALSLIHI